MNTLNPLQKSAPKRGLFLNPLLGKLTNLKETSQTQATYAGIFGKCLFFVLMIFAGLAFGLVLNELGMMGVVAGTDEVTVEKFAIILLLASLVIFLVMPLLAFVIRATIPVTGSIYCLCTCFMLSFMMVLDAELKAYILLALVFTVSIVVAMGVLFAKGYINVTRKFRAVTSVLFSTMLLGSLLMFICSLIPALKDGVALLMGNGILNLLCCIGGVIIAAMFLLIDFDTIRQTVEDRLPKKYEWFAAFGTVFTVVWLYFKILDLIMRVKDMGK